MPNKPTPFESLQHVCYGDLVKNEATAIALAELLIQKNFGDEALKNQQPLLMTRQNEEYWQVEGSLNRDGAAGHGPVILNVRKRDAGVPVCYFSFNMDKD